MLVEISFMYVAIGFVTLITLSYFLLRYKKATNNSSKDSLFMRDASKAKKQSKQTTHHKSTLSDKQTDSPLSIPDQKTYQLTLVSAQEHKLSVIKETKTIMNLGLKEAKELVDNLPQVIMQGLSKGEVMKMRQRLVESGAIVEIK